MPRRTILNVTIQTKSKLHQLRDDYSEDKSISDNDLVLELIDFVQKNIDTQDK